MENGNRRLSLYGVFSVYLRCIYADCVCHFGHFIKAVTDSAHSASQFIAGIKLYQALGDV